jgi:hypothetical protein
VSVLRRSSDRARAWLEPLGGYSVLAAGFAILERALDCFRHMSSSRFVFESSDLELAGIAVLIKLFLDRADLRITLLANSLAKLNLVLYCLRQSSHERRLS